MKHSASFLTAVLLAATIGCGPSTEANRQAYVKLDGEIANNLQGTKDAIRAQHLYRVELSFGHLVRLNYEQCQTNPPKLAKNQKMCHQLVARVDAAIKREDDQHAKNW